MQVGYICQQERALHYLGSIICVCGKIRKTGDGYRKVGEANLKDKLSRRIKKRNHTARRNRRYLDRHSLKARRRFDLNSNGVKCGNIARGVGLSTSKCVRGSRFASTGECRRISRVGA